MKKHFFLKYIFSLFSETEKGKKKNAKKKGIAAAAALVLLEQLGKKKGCPVGVERFVGGSDGGEGLSRVVESGAGFSF